MERWSSIEEFSTYSVSDLGRVRNDSTKRIMTNTELPSGHQYAALSIGGGFQKRRAVSKLVANAFVHNPEPDTYNTPIHLDGRLQNSMAVNLLWRPRWFANSYTRQFRVDYDKFPPIEDLRTGEIYIDVWDLIMRRGLLLREIVQSIQYNTHVFPTKDRFRWL